MKVVDLEQPVQITEPPIQAHPVREEESVPDPTNVPDPKPAEPQPSPPASKSALPESAKQFFGGLLTKWTSRSLVAWAGACWMLTHQHIDKEQWMWVTCSMIFGTKALDAVEAFTKRS